MNAYNDPRLSSFTLNDVFRFVCVNSPAFTCPSFVDTLPTTKTSSNNSRTTYREMNNNIVERMSICIFTVLRTTRKRKKKLFHIIIYYLIFVEQEKAFKVFQQAKTILIAMVDDKLIMKKDFFVRNFCLPFNDAMIRLESKFNKSSYYKSSWHSRSSISSSFVSCFLLSSPRLPLNSWYHEPSHCQIIF